MRGITLRTTLRSEGISNLPTWVLEFQQRLTSQGFAKTTVRGYLYDLLFFCEWSSKFRGTDQIDGITDHDTAAYRQYLLKALGLKPNTVNRRLFCLKKAALMAIKSGSVADEVAESFRVVRKPKERQPKALTDKEVYALLRAAGLSDHGLDRRNYAIIQVLLQTGLRVSELASIKMKDINLSERSGTLYVRLGKGDKDRVVPLNSSARRALTRYLQTVKHESDESSLFYSERSLPLTVRGIQFMVQTLVKKANIDRIPATVHTLRHTFATNYLKSNPGKLLELSSILGHESLVTTSIYVRPSETALAEDMERLDINAFD